MRKEDPRDEAATWRALRNAAYLSQIVAGERIPMCERHLRKIELGQAPGSAGRYRAAACRVYGVTLTEFSKMLDLLRKARQRNERRGR